MRKLLDFLYRRRTLAVFIGLEAVCFWLVVNFNQRQQADFLNSSNALAARVTATSQDVSDYFSLVEINRQLMDENLLLQRQIGQTAATSDSSRLVMFNYKVFGARVVNNTFRRSINFLTIAAGTNQGIKPGMGVISPRGVVGQIKSVSDNYATAYSLLHPNVMVSSTIKNTETNCSVQWDQREFRSASLKYVPRHIPLQVGDTVVTSGFNSIFPAGINVGVVSEIQLEDHMTFYDAKVSLSTDFTSIPHVFVLTNEKKSEIDSLESL